jgi:hypothetical protein
MDVRIKRLLVLVGVVIFIAGLNWLVPDYWWQITLIVYSILFIYVVIKKWKSWLVFGGMLNELIKNKLEVTEDKNERQK